jgi:sortase A
MKKYGNFLTILLIILIIIGLAIGGYYLYTLYESYTSQKKADELINEFENNTETEVEIEEDSQEVEENISEENNTDKTNSSNSTYYNGYKVIGTLSIPSLNVSVPIFDVDNTATLKLGVAAIYPANVENALNKPGNVVIAGHNYHNNNGRIFSKIDKLKENDIIEITDSDGNKVEYKVYKNYDTSASDFTYATRQTNGETEISLSTCTTDENTRTIIWARK